MESAAESRSAYAHLSSIPTRWADNDIYGHVNNVEYHSFFDTVINSWLITEGGLLRARALPPGRGGGDRVGWFVHVSVDRESPRPVEIMAPPPDALRRLIPAP